MKLNLLLFVTFLCVSATYCKTLAAGVQTSRHQRSASAPPGEHGLVIDIIGEGLPDPNKEAEDYFQDADDDAEDGATPASTHAPAPAPAPAPSLSPADITNIFG